MPGAYIPPHLRKKVEKKSTQTRRAKKQLRFPSNTTGENSFNVKFAPVSKLFGETVKSVYKVFSDTFATRKVRRKSLRKVLKTGTKQVLRASSASPLKKKTLKKRPASV